MRPFPSIVPSRPWSSPERLATPEPAVLGCRAALEAAATVALARPSQAALPPAVPGPDFGPHGAATAEEDATTYNNFYEFGSHKGIWRAAQRILLRPWVLSVEGMVDRPLTLDADDLLRRFPLEERTLRLRCVEAWAMVVPWTGFPLSALLAAAGPQAGARYVAVEPAALPGVMPGLRQTWYPWPHRKGCTLAEAANPMAFLAVGMYGKPLPPQNGGPVRLLLPWKYGFKSGQSLVRIRLTDARPPTFWSTLQPAEYGFWANVNPEVAHPRWSQATERLLGTGERVPTRLFNGYGPWVAELYGGRTDPALFR